MWKIIFTLVQIDDNISNLIMFLKTAVLIMIMSAAG